MSYRLTTALCVAQAESRLDPLPRATTGTRLGLWQFHVPFGARYAPRRAATRRPALRIDVAEFPQSIHERDVTHAAGGYWQRWEHYCQCQRFARQLRQRRVLQAELTPRAMLCYMYLRSRRVRGDRLGSFCILVHAGLYPNIIVKQEPPYERRPSVPFAPRQRKRSKGVFALSWHYRSLRTKRLTVLRLAALPDHHKFIRPY
jgi:hypothetical protein